MTSSETGEDEEHRQSAADAVRAPACPPQVRWRESQNTKVSFRSIVDVSPSSAGCPAHGRPRRAGDLQTKEEESRPLQMRALFKDSSSAFLFIFLEYICDCVFFFKCEFKSGLLSFTVAEIKSVKSHQLSARPLLFEVQTDGWTDGGTER